MENQIGHNSGYEKGFLMQLRSLITLGHFLDGIGFRKAFVDSSMKDWLSDSDFINPAHVIGRRFNPLGGSLGQTAILYSIHGIKMPWDYLQSSSLRLFYESLEYLNFCSSDSALCSLRGFVEWVILFTGSRTAVWFIKLTFLNSTF